jgi:hypothetical protein
MRKVLVGRRTLSARIDCAQAESITDFLRVLEHAIGFVPSFSALYSLRAYVDMIVSFGKAEKISSSSAQQLAELLGTLSLALQAVHLSGRVLSHSPIIVFDNFDVLLTRAAEADVKSAELLEALVTWAVEQTDRDYGHVVFVAESTFAEERLQAFPCLRGKLNVVVARDAPRDQVVPFVQERLSVDREEANAVFDLVGGRLRDLEAFVDRMSVAAARGASLTDELQAVRAETTRSLVLRLFGEKAFVDRTDGMWRPYHVWHLCRAFGGLQARVPLLADEEIRERDLLLSDDDGRPMVSLAEVLLYPFKGDEVAVRALVMEGILSVIRSRQGAEYRTLAPASPLVAQSLRSLLEDGAHAEFRRGMNGMLIVTDLDKYTKEIRSIQDELISFAQARSTVGRATRERMVVLEERLEVLNRYTADKERQLQALRSAAGRGLSLPYFPKVGNATADDD